MYRKGETAAERNKMQVKHWIILAVERNQMQIKHWFIIQLSKEIKCKSSTGSFQLSNVHAFVSICGMPNGEIHFAEGMKNEMLATVSIRVVKQQQQQQQKPETKTRARGVT